MSMLLWPSQKFPVATLQKEPDVSDGENLGDGPKLLFDSVKRSGSECKLRVDVPNDDDCLRNFHVPWDFGRLLVRCVASLHDDE